METINFALKFIYSGSPEPPIPPSPLNPVVDPTEALSGTGTGDPLFMTILFLLIISIVGISSYFYFKRPAKTLPKHNAKVYRRMQNHYFQTIGIALAVFILPVFLIWGVGPVAFGNQQNDLDNTVTVFVAEDGTTTIPKCEVTNTLENHLMLKESIYEITDSSVSNILEDSELTLSGLDGVLFEGVPNTTYSVEPNIRNFIKGESEQFTIDLHLKNKEDALKLCDKTPINVSVTGQRNAYASINFDIAEVKDESQIPTGWSFNDGIYQKNYDVMADYQAILHEWNNVEFFYPWASLSGYTPATGNLTEDTQFDAIWEINPEEKSLDEYSWDELSFISDDIAINADIEKGSTSIYYEKFKEFADDGDIKNIQLNDGSNLAVRIIGINHDSIRNVKKAGLTFSAVHALSNGYIYDEGIGSNWATSDLRDNMNNSSGDIYKLFPDDLMKNVPAISKEYSKGWDRYRNGFDIEQNTSLDKFWIASATELGYDKEDYTDDPVCGEEGYIYEYSNRDPYSDFRFEYLSDAGPLLTMLTYDGYNFVTTHKSYFSGIYDIYDYCKANGLLIDNQASLSTGLSATRTLQEIYSTYVSDSFAGLNYFKGITTGGSFEKADCPAKYSYAIVPCFCVGKDFSDTISISGKVSFDTPRSEGHSETMKSGLPVYFTYMDGKNKIILSGNTDVSGNYEIEGVPFGYSGNLSFGNMGYYSELDVQNIVEDQKLDFAAKGPYLEYYTWNNIKDISDYISDGSISDSLFNEFKNYANTGEVKEVILNEGTINQDFLFVRIIGFNSDFKTEYGNNDTAGMTFMALNSPNYTKAFTDLDSSSSSYLTSIPYKELNDGGSIYESLPQDLKESIPPVIKKSIDGWDSLIYSPNINYELHKMFLPSITELGFNDEGIIDEGAKYEYIANDGYNKISCLSYHVAPLFTSANAFGYKWILEHGNEYSNIEDIYRAVGNAGGLPNFIVPEFSYADTALTRDVNANFITNVWGIRYDGYINDEVFRAVAPTTICPCFCVGSPTPVATTRTVSGYVDNSSSRLEQNEDFAGMNVFLEFDPSRKLDTRICKVDENGYFEFKDIPVYSNVVLSASGKGYIGYYGNLYVDDNIDNIKITVQGPTLEGFSWEELKKASKELSENKMSEEKKALFELMASRGDLKKVTLTNSDKSHDYLYVRIADFCHDEYANPSLAGKKAGITFIAANAINESFAFDSLLRMMLFTNHAWSCSILRETLNNGDVYSRLPEELKLLISPVKKESVEGWTNIVVPPEGEPAPNPDEFSFSDKIVTTEDKLFIPSFSELGITGNEFYQFEEGTKYKYIEKDPYTDRLSHITSKHPFLVGLNYLGLERVLNDAQVTTLPTIQAIYDDCYMHGGAVLGSLMSFKDALYYSGTRSIPFDAEASDDLMLASIFCHGIYSYASDDDAGVQPPESADIWDGCTVSPCFCL